MKFLIIGFSVIILAGCDKSREVFVPHGSISKEEAIESAIRSISIQYPDISRSAENWNARYEDKIWTVYPKVPQGHLGGGPSARVGDGTESVEVFFGE